MKKIIILLLLNAPQLLIAHPGHDGMEVNDGYTIIHFFTNVDHLFISGISFFVLALVWFTKSKKSKLIRSKV